MRKVRVRVAWLDLAVRVRMASSAFSPSPRSSSLVTASSRRVVVPLVSLRPLSVAHKSTALERIDAI